jgi:hypothetical protein
MIVYKLVSFNEDGDMFSALLHSRKYRLQYRLKHETKPIIGKIMAFDTFENAVDYANSGCRVLKCHACKVEVADNLFIPFCDNADSEYENYWKGKGTYRNETPRGTVFCDKITPLEIVYEKKHYKY